MGSLADYIEEYIKRLFQEATRDVIEIQRSQLAKMFGCVPSQINYVLSTRFTVENGYIVESRRGGGGYIRVIKINRRALPDVSAMIADGLGDALTEAEADRMLDRLQDLGLITEGERLSAKAVLSRELTGIPRELSPLVRARLLRGILTLILRQ